MIGSDKKLLDVITKYGERIAYYRYKSIEFSGHGLVTVFHDNGKTVYPNVSCVEFYDFGEEEIAA